MMNDKFTNTPHPDDESIARKLNQAAEQTHANAQFAAELEERLRSAHQPRAGWFSGTFSQVSPTLRWLALMVLLALVLSWSIKSLIPAPQPATDETPTPFDLTTPTPITITAGTATPAPVEGGYDFRGAKLFLEQPLPGSPAQAHVYGAVKDTLEPATPEQARALADRFGIRGEMYTAPGLIYGTSNFVISDGKQFLQVHSERYFTYTADMAKNNRAYPLPKNPDAEAIIREFLTARGFDFPFRVYPSELAGGYAVQPLAPDSIPMQYESFSQPMIRAVLDENGQVLTINASLLDYDPNPIGEYGIISAQEALEKLLDERVAAGKMEFFHSPSTMPQQWYREYPDGQTVTVYGNVTSNPSTDPGRPALVLIDGIPVTGNTGGMENLEYYAYVTATGQFIVENGIRKFNVESWDTNLGLVYLSGTLHREGELVILTSDDGSDSQYPLIDPPADLPVDVNPESNVAISGVLVNGEMFWTYIQYFEGTSGGGGGGGGGGSGFYQLNLSGMPVPFPTAPLNPEIHVITYVVQENDTLASIAQQFGISVEELIVANDITGNEVRTGQTLTVPIPRSITDRGTGQYTVQEGDTLAKIAQSYGVSVEELIKANGLTQEGIISVGQTLVIPSGQSNPLIGKRFEDQRGLFIVNIYRQPDGSQRTEYAFSIMNGNENYYLKLEPEGLEGLDKYHNRPMNIWATIKSADQFGGLTAKVDQFEVPFPDLPIQIFKGTQNILELEGQSVLTFTAEDGTTYVQMGPAGDIWNEGAMFGTESDTILLEGLAIPDETVAGYPTLRIFGMAYAVDPISGQANELTVTADQPYIMEEDPGLENYVPPSLTITSVELVYYVSNPYYQVNDPNYEQRSPHIQPVWHFQGRYEDGNQFDILIQALKQEFLLPELVPGVAPG